ncbi:hypothetical protein PFISCL1PPCAC_357, partial [Pristionchus fissidentatus]
IIIFQSAVDTRTSAIKAESPEFTVIDLGDDPMDYRIPSAPVEVSPPPTYIEDGTNGNVRRK